MKTGLFLIMLITSHFLLAQQREQIVLQKGWKFTKGNPTGATERDTDVANWQSVEVPHDWAIQGPFVLDGDGNTGKLPWKGEGWYRTSLPIRPSWSGKRIYLVFDGVLAFPEVFVNGKAVGKWDYGYNSFYLDVTEAIQFGESNVLAVHADTRAHDSRWYPGAGIYRKVQLLAVDPLHATIWGTAITTPVVKDSYADIRIRTEVTNRYPDSVGVRVEQVVADPQGREVGRGSVRKTLLPGQSHDLEVTLTVPSPLRWDVEHPHLYTLNTHVYRGDRLVDVQTQRFGIRTIAFTADDGFHLNGRRVQLKGVNLHHDHGPLGAAFHPVAMRRQLEIMKAMGANAVRNSHNTAAPEFLELCDEMGLLVFNEIFDKYDAKAGITPQTDFEEFAHRNIRNFVMRDRNHPSIFIWSVGNEIADVQQNQDNGFHRLHTMVNYVRKYDPTRPTTLACDNMLSASLRHFDYYDVHSWNYGQRYRLARKLEPNKSVIISESASTLSTRGFYEFPLPAAKTDFTRALQISSYDLHAPEWAELADDDFMWQQEEPYVAGEFVWTGFDYLGEPTPYTNEGVGAMGLSAQSASRSSYFGIVDLVGIPKDRYYLYKSHWKPEEPTLHVLPHWNWPGREGDTVPVFVYTNAESAELFINGQSQGMRYKQPKSEHSVERFRLMWKEVIYQPGEVKVVAYKDGKVMAEKVVRTAAEAYQLKLTPERGTLRANGTDLVYVLVEAFDRNGNPHPLASHQLSITLKGPAALAGVGNGNPQSFDSFQGPTVKLFYGKAMIILKAGEHRGNALLSVSADGLKNDAVTIKVE